MTRYARDFGVVMDGAADNSDAVWQASLACYPLQEKLVFDSGKCRITKPVAVSPGVAFVGEGLAGRGAADTPSGWNVDTDMWDNNRLPPTGTIFVIDSQDPDPYAAFPRFEMRPGSGMIGFIFVDAGQDAWTAQPIVHPAVVSEILEYWFYWLYAKIRRAK